MNERLQVYEDKMKKTIGSLESDLMTIRAGRANPNILNKVMVDYYGTPTPLQQVGNISVPEANSASKDSCFAFAIIPEILEIRPSTYSFGCSFPASRLSMSSRPEAQGPECVCEQLIITFRLGIPHSVSTRLRTFAT